MFREVPHPNDYGFETPFIVTQRAPTEKMAERKVAYIAGLLTSLGLSVHVEGTKQMGQGPRKRFLGRRSR